MLDLRLALAGDGAVPGEAYLGQTRLLRRHAGTQPDLFLRWNAVPLSARSIDVVVHLHGFSQQRGRMLLSEKVARGGLDLAGRNRPSLAMLPRGNWIRHYYYDFPALLAGGLDALVDHGVALLARAMGALSPAGEGRLTVDRFILTAHSGGGMPAVDAVAGASRQPDELYVFDGLYGRDPATGDPLQGVEVIDRWLGDRIAQEPERPGALRIVFIERETGPFSRRVAAIVGQHLARADPELHAVLSRRYRVEAAVGVQHSRIAWRCTPELLSASDVEFDWAAWPG